jgi:ubiquinone biosynthesis accessory factor UbiJ
MNVSAEIVNRTLDREPWARERLAAHAGRTVRLVVGPARITYGIDNHGRLQEAVAAPDLTLTIAPLRLPGLLAQPSRWQQVVVADGDAGLAATLAELALTLPMFVEQAFARALGPIIGQQCASAGRRLLSMPEYAAERFGSSVAHYVAEETGGAVRASEARAFAADVSALAADVEALSARIDALLAAVPRKH